MVKTIGPVSEGNIVEVFKLGNTIIKICDDAYKNNTKEDTERILKRIAQIAYENLYASLSEPEA